MARVKKIYGPTVTLVRRKKIMLAPEPELMSPEIAKKLAILAAVIESGENHGFDRLDELAREQAEIEELKLECRARSGGKET